MALRRKPNTVRVHAVTQTRQAGSNLRLPPKESEDYEEREVQILPIKGQIVFDPKTAEELRNPHELLDDPDGYDFYRPEYIVREQSPGTRVFEVITKPDLCNAGSATNYISVILEERDIV